MKPEAKRVCETTYTDIIHQYIIRQNQNVTEESTGSDL